MKCKPGDLAIVTRSYSGRFGAIVEVVEFVGVATTLRNGIVDDAWAVVYRGSNKHPDSGVPLLARDRDLTPIPPPATTKREPQHAEV